jgi:hypothetical protein
MYFHSASDRSVGYLFLIPAKVAKYRPRTLFIQFQKGNSQKFVKPTFSEVGISPVLRGRISYVRWTTKLLVLYSLPGPTDRGRASFAWRGFSEVQDRNPSTLALRLCGFA